VHLTFPPNGAWPINPVDARLPLPPVVIDIPAQRYPSGHSTAAIAGVKVDFSTMTSYGAIFGVTYALQDGSPPGTLNYATIKATGELEAHYSDGRVDRSRRLALARTTTADRLHRYGVSGWICGRGCQSPVVTQPGQMLTGMLVSGALNAGQ
jgi:flagellar hook protein FlgE